MAKRNEAEQLLRQGLYPSEIAARMGISVKSVVQYLRTQVGEGSLRLSDLYFSWPPEKREILQRAGRGRYPDDRLLSTHGLSRDDLELFKSLSTPGVFNGDLYEYVSVTELAIHRLVRTRLERELTMNPDFKEFLRRIKIDIASKEMRKEKYDKVLKREDLVKTIER